MIAWPYIGYLTMSEVFLAQFLFFALLVRLFVPWLPPCTAPQPLGNSHATVLRCLWLGFWCAWPCAFLFGVLTHVGLPFHAPHLVFTAASGWLVVQLLNVWVVRIIPERWQFIGELVILLNLPAALVLPILSMSLPSEDSGRVVSDGALILLAIASVVGHVIASLLLLFSNRLSATTRSSQPLE